MSNELEYRTKIANRFVRFTGVGAIGTLAHYLSLVSLVEIVGLNAVAATCIGFIVGALINYKLNRRYTFESSVPHRIGLPRFLVIAAIGMVLNTSIMAVGTLLLKVHYLLLQVFATAVVLLWNFFGNHFWTFRHG